MKGPRCLIGCLGQPISINSRNFIHLSEISWCNIMIDFLVFCFNFCLCICSEGFSLCSHSWPIRDLKLTAYQREKNIHFKFYTSHMLINHNFLYLFEILFLHSFKFFVTVNLHVRLCLFDGMDII